MVVVGWGMDASMGENEDLGCNEGVGREGDNHLHLWLSQIPLRGNFQEAVKTNTWSSTLCGVSSVLIFCRALLDMFHQPLN